MNLNTNIIAYQKLSDYIDLWQFMNLPDIAGESLVGRNEGIRADDLGERVVGVESEWTMVDGNMFCNKHAQFPRGVRGALGEWREGGLCVVDLLLIAQSLVATEVSSCAHWRAKSPRDVLTSPKKSIKRWISSNMEKHTACI